MTAHAAPAPASTLAASLRTRVADAPRTLLIGLALLAFLVLAGVFAGLLAGHDPRALNPGEQFAEPSSGALFGTDQLGMDVFSRTLHAIRTDVPVAVGAIGLALLIGVPLGALGALVGGPLDALLGRLTDAFQAFPALLLALLVGKVLGAGTINTALIIAVIWAPVFARLTRVQLVTLKLKPYVEAARSFGHSWPRITVQHLIPNAASALLAQAALGIGYAVLLAAALGFVGLGVPFPTPEWGAMIASGSEQIPNGKWWISVFPGLALVLTVISFSLIAEGIQETSNPRMR